MYTPSQYATRVTTRAVSLQDVTIPEGEIVNLWLSSANRDGQAFDAPGTFDMSRASDRHLAFGDGPRYCLGAAFTIVQIAGVLEELLARFGSLSLTEPVEWLDSLMAFRPKRLVVGRGRS